MRTILVGLDGSTGANRALTWAVERARESDAALLAVHVLTYSTEFGRDLTLDTVTTWRRELETQLRGEWTAPARRAGIAVAVELLEADSAASGLLTASERPDVDLVVLGAQGHANIADRLLGATTYKVSHAAKTPVVIVPRHWTPRAAA